MDTEKEKDPRRLSRIHWLVGRESERGPLEKNYYQGYQAIIPKSFDSMNRCKAYSALRN